MKGLILAAGLGTRLRPWTDSHPKALVPVAGKPALQRVIEKMLGSGISDITVNVFHFANQIIDFIRHMGWEINIFDERPDLLETGGAILKAANFLDGTEPILVHNADIMSNADFNLLEYKHLESQAEISLLVSDRESSRKLVFSPDNALVGWHDLKNGTYRPESFRPTPEFINLAFSGIYILNPSLITIMKKKGWYGKFSIIDFLISSLNEYNYRGIIQPGLTHIDIGKPDSLARANEEFNNIL